jgi:hypothetical protein
MLLIRNDSTPTNDPPHFKKQAKTIEAIQNLDSLYLSLIKYLITFL